MSTFRLRPISAELLLFALILVFFFVSGACGLLYQVVWTRKLVLLFGTTAYAVSTVLSMFFLGLALGSLWGGRLADRSATQVRLYGIMEILIGVWAVLFILLVGFGESVVVEILRLVGNSRPMAIGLRALMAAVFLIVPVTLMGATLPLLARFVAAAGPKIGMRVGSLYTVNTLGAVAGCAATGFWFLPNLGYTQTTYLGAVLNVGVGILALGVSRSALARLDSNATVPVKEPSEDFAEPITTRVALGVAAAFALSGFCSLALEVIWTRLLSIVYFGTTYAFTTMLTTVLCGIALGSGAASLFIDRLRHRVAWFGLLQILTGVACLLMLLVFPMLPDALAQYRVDAAYEWDRLIFPRFLLSFAVLFAPTFLFGMSFPFAVRILTASQRTLGRDVGLLYSVNTFGGVFGAAAGGFLVLPLLGAHLGIAVLASLLCVMGVHLVVICPTLRRVPAFTFAGAGAVAVTLVAVVSVPGDVNESLNQWFVPENHERIFLREGIEGTVLVTAPIHETHDSERYLWINAVQATASIEKGVKMNRFEGVLPMLFDREMNSGLFMCFGTGITLGTLALQPFDSIDAVEISEDVLEAAELFAEDNFRVFENDRVNFITDDGRNFLLTTTKKYDLITFAPMPLALSGVSTFYTKEYYEQCRRRLTPGGLVMQWVPLHSLSEEIVRSLCATFIHVFPEATAWFVNSDLYLIGSNEPLQLSHERAQRRLEENPVLWDGLESVYLGDLTELYASYFMGKENLAKFANGAALMTDDRPWAEFVAPKYIYSTSDEVPRMLEALKPYRESPLALFNRDTVENWEKFAADVERRHRAHVNDMDGLVIYYGGSVFSEPEKVFRESLEIDPDDLNAQHYLADILLAKGRMFASWSDKRQEGIAMLREAARYAPTRPDVHLALGDAFFEEGRYDRAAESYRRYLDLDGNEARARERAESD